MARFIELTRQEFNEFKKIKQAHSELHGDYMLYGRRHCKKKYIAKALTQQYMTTRSEPIEFYRGEHETLFFYEIEGECLQDIFNYKNETVNSKAKNSELVCWMTKHKNFQGNLEEFLKLALKLQSQGQIEILMSCFRVSKQRLIYHYEGWFRDSASIVQKMPSELERYYFSPNNLQQIKQQQPLTNNKKSIFFKIALMTLHLGTRQLNHRLYQFCDFAINTNNLHKRMEVFRLKYPKLFNKIVQLLHGTMESQEWEKTSSYSTIYQIDTLMKKDCFSILEDSFLSKCMSDKENTHSKKNLESRKIKEKSKTLRKMEDLRQIVILSDPDALSTHKGQSLYIYLNMAIRHLESPYEVKVGKMLKEILIRDNWTRKVYSNDSIYVGQLSSQNRQGRGLYVFQSGDIYYGGWKDNKMHGFGRYIYKNGEMYEGELKDGLKHGHGLHQYCNGNMYEGNWNINKKEGLGVLKYSSGCSFVGVFYGGRKEAEGVYVDEHGNVKEGILEISQECKPSMKKKPKDKQITGVCQFQDGIYQGDLLNGKRQGFGILTNSEYTFEGHWKDDMKHGHGKLKTQIHIIEGIWQSGLMIEYCPTS